MSYRCDVCGDHYCPGCETDDPYAEERAEAEAEAEDLRTSAASLDARDATKKPPAYLNPYWVLRMRRRLERFKISGSVDWFPSTLSQPIIEGKSQ